MDEVVNFPRLGAGHHILSGLESCCRIGVFRALQLGDMLCVVPALRALRQAAPDAHISLIGLPWAESFARRFHRYIDSFFSFPGYPGLPEHPVELSRIPGFMFVMQEQRFDVLLQLHGSGVLTNPLVASFGAARTAGFFTEGNFCPDARYFMPWEEKQHEIRRNLQLLSWLGLPAEDDELEFPLEEKDWRRLHECGEKLPPPGSYVCIHPGARMPSRRWPAERFAAVADRLRREGLAVVLTGAKEESELVQSVERAMHAKPINLCGRTDLGAFAALVAEARLVVCNDTGTSHIATAVKTPSVVISCGSDSRRWAPLDSRRHRTLAADVPCRPCMHQVCPIGHLCADQIDAEAVYREVCLVLSDNARTDLPAGPFTHISR
ncbi:ADP-heptose:LPS heptosyltransferase [Paucimonas lemoignei]|uniref:ADP-heptose:LPS heptosyltransferase n=1 Tax=Paucimonas lemoignei TaxID=29443 RepID=A0A4R3HT50_PAULE|nr:glycosyltransferase family 9 protein [Paucimonas lemoignei]TCS34692.1 ADP-heptose:LPS heptosyltransferase [Paucimonas lemoignei]